MMSLFPLWLAFFKSWLLSTVGAQHNNVLPAQYIEPLPAEFSNASVVLLNKNLAVLPDWTVVDLDAPFYNIGTNDSALATSLAQIKAADFIAFDFRFLDFISKDAKVERVISFPGVKHVHEAPIWVDGELIFSDTSDVGSLYAFKAATGKSRKILTTPPTNNVNGATYVKGDKYSNGSIYICTNGGPTRGIFSLNLTDGATTPIVNNYRGRKLNSPNDVITDKAGNLWFTDPAYGWYTPWSNVEQPQLPNTVYFFNITTSALIPVSVGTVLVPNGLAFSNDHKTLYVSDTNSTSGQGLNKAPDSVRGIWAFDVKGSQLSNAHLVYQAEVGAPDGLKVTNSGLIIVGVTSGADVFDPKTGVLLGKINAVDDVIYNVAKGEAGVWWLTGRDHIYKVTIKE